MGFPHHIMLLSMIVVLYFYVEKGGVRGRESERRRWGGMRPGLLTPLPPLPLPAQHRFLRASCCSGRGQACPPRWRGLILLRRVRVGAGLPCPAWPDHPSTRHVGAGARAPPIRLRVHPHWASALTGPPPQSSQLPSSLGRPLTEPPSKSSQPLTLSGPACCPSPEAARLIHFCPTSLPPRPRYVPALQLLAGI